MKIAIVSLQFEETATGGGGVHVKNITDQFLKLGHEVTIISIHTNKTIPGSELKDKEGEFSVQTRGKLKIVRFLVDRGIEQPYVGTKDEELDRIKRFADIASAWIKKNISEFDVINLQGHHILPGYMAKELAGTGPKIISYLHALETTYVTGDGQFVGAFNGTYEVLKRIREWESMCRYADYVIGNSPKVNNEFKQILKENGACTEKNKKKIKLIASGCNADFLMREEEVRQKLRNPSEPVELVSFCRIDPSKGLEYSIGGARKASEKSSRKFRLTIAGMPSSEEYLKKLRDEAAEVPSNLEVRFDIFDSISPEKEKKAILDNKHIYILPTLKEPFGMSIIEASARGNMIVSAETNGPKYMFQSQTGRNADWGIITDYGVLADITEDHMKNFSNNIGEAIIWTVSNWEECVNHVVLFNEKIRKIWTWRGIAAQYMKLFKD